MTVLKKIFLLTLLFLLISTCLGQTIANSVNRQEIAALYQQLSIEQQQLAISQTKLADLKVIREQQLSRIKAIDVRKQMLERASLNLAIALADLSAINQSVRELQDKLAAIKSHVARLIERLQEVRLTTSDGSSRNEKISVLQAAIDYQQSLYNLQSNRLLVLEKSQHVAQEEVKLEQIWVNKLTQLHQEHLEQKREEAIEQLASAAQHESKAWLEKLANYSLQLQSYTAEQRYTDPTAILLSVKIFHAQESVFLSRLRFDLARLQDSVESLSAYLKKTLPLSEIDKLQSTVNQLTRQADQMNQQLVAKQYLLESQLKISRQSQEQGIITDQQLKEQLAIYSSLIRDYSEVHKILEPLRKKISNYRSDIQKILNEAIAKRQGLPGLDVQTWLTLLKNVSLIPNAILGLFNALFEQVRSNFTTMSWPWIFLIILLEMMWFAIWGIGRHFAFLGIKAVDESQKIGTNTIYIFLRFYQKNLLSILLFGGLILLLVMSGVTYQFYRILIYLSLIWFGYRALDDLSRFTLLESVLHTSGDDVWLYHRLKWVFKGGALITALTVLVNELTIAYDIRDFFNRLFMLFLLALSIVLFRARKVVPTLLKPYLEQSRPYVTRLIALMSTLIPLTLLSNAITGLIGYVQLAWVMSYYQAVFLLVVAAYVIIRGLLIDLLAFVSDLSINYLQNGWLWSQAILKPLDRIVRIAAVLIAIAILFYAYGWGPQSWIVKKIATIFNYPIYIFTQVGTTVNLSSIIEFTILVVVVVWAARWTREFAYRWIFSSINDLGLRNSLAVFSQYATIAIGAIITLRLIGIDVSGLSYILGGLAVGLGFGLRDFANNIVGGVMILIERPIREGDIVTIGQFEGTIIHMGIRSSMIKSWDNMEVLIPNSEIFNKVFTNWTLQDNTVRTVINLNIHRQDDPVKIVNLITALLHTIPEILKYPETQVYLNEISRVFIEVEVRYYINVREHSRAEVRSNVLLAIVELFKQHNLHPPYPRQDIQMISSHSEDRESEEDLSH